MAHKAIIITIFLPIFVLGGFFVFGHSAIATTVEYISEDTTWTKEQSPILIIDTQIRVHEGVTLTIEPGVIIKSDYWSGLYMLRGVLHAIGTASEPIIFTSIKDDEYGGDSNGDGDASVPAISDWSQIKFYQSPGSIIDHVVVRYSGSPGYIDAIYGSYSQVSISNSIITDNASGVRNDNGTVTVNNSAIYNNVALRGPYQDVDVGISAYSSFTDVINNWWGSAEGPCSEDELFGPSYFWTPEYINSVCGGRPLVNSESSYDPWLDYNPFDQPEIDPVIIVPGILGSWKINGEWRIDPILGTYNNLMEAFISAGYREPLWWEDDPNLFTFPYDWREDNNITAQKLKDKIQEVKDITGGDRVDLVAHSMGGLVARAYIQSNDYQNDVDQVIFLGTPHLGSPEGYPRWDGIYFGGGLKDIMYETIFTIEAIFNGYINLVDYIHDKVPTISQLLPTYDYLKDEDENNDWQIRNYPDSYPQNGFLENLNSSEQLDRLKQRVDITNIVGNIDSSTLEYIKVIEDPNLNDNLWEHGYPIDLDNNEDAFELGSGDGTVPYKSADFFNDVDLIETTYLHNELPTTMQQDIIEILTGSRPTEYFDNAMLYNISRWSIFRVYSPVDFVVIAPDGRRVGKDFATGDVLNEIEDAFYSGFDSHTEFVLIPNPIDGEYQIELQGVDGGGQYTLAVDFIDEDMAELHQEFSVSAFVGEGQIDNFFVTYNHDDPNESDMESDADFSKLIDLTKMFYNNGAISKNAAYNFLVNNFEQLSKKYDKILTNNKKSNIEKQLEQIKQKLEFYVNKDWITIFAKEILISNINLLIHKL